MSKKSLLVDVILGGLTFVTMLLSFYAIFTYAPVEKTMGAVQKIFYLHLPLAMLSFVAFFIVFITSMIYLHAGTPLWDIWAYCAAEVGVVFCTLVLITGSIWAKPTWNVWWTWDPRLTTVLMLWSMYIAYLMLRKLLKPGAKTSNIAAVFGIISFANVPLTFVAIRKWHTIHPVVIDSKGIHISPPMLHTLVIGFLAMSLLFVLLLRLRVRVEQSQHRYYELRFLAEKQRKQKGENMSS